MIGRTGSGARTVDYERLGMRIVALLLLFELASVFFLWTFNPVGPLAEPAFALLLATDLISFAMISYIYRVLKMYNRFGRLPLLAGCVFISALLFLGFML